MSWQVKFRTKFVRDQWQATNAAVPNQSQHREAELGEVVIQPSPASATTLILANDNAAAMTNGNGGRRDEAEPRCSENVSKRRWLAAYWVKGETKLAV